MMYEESNQVNSQVLSIHYSDNVVEAAQYLMAISLFKSFRDKGLLTEEEYRCIANDAEKRWRNLLYDDSMGTNRVVFKEQKNE